jgi:DNA processing protein
MSGGALVSTFPPLTPPCEQNFPVRNRVLSALCDALIVARAGRESGALMTARASHKLGRPVLGICGRMGEEQSRGVTQLIREGTAKPMDAPEDVLAALGHPPRLDVALPSLALPRTSLPPVPVEYRKVIAALESGPRHMDEIAAASGFTISALASALTELEMLGLCEVRLGGLFAAVPGAGFACATEAV